MRVPPEACYAVSIDLDSFHLQELHPTQQKQHVLHPAAPIISHLWLDLQQEQNIYNINRMEGTQEEC